MNRKFEVEKLDHFGKGVSHLDNKVLFIENALDEEVVEVKIESEKKKVIFGSAINIIEESPNRKEAECPYYNLCGGCNVMHMNYRKQLDFKFNKVSELLERFAGVSSDKIKEIIPSNEFNYRNKATFKVGEKLSYCKNKTYELIGIDKCIICSEKINELVSIINNLSLSNIEEVIIRSTYKNESMIVFKLVGDINRDYFIRNLEKYTDTLIIIKDGIEEVLFGKGFITEKIGDYYFKISPRSFFQVNTVGAQKLYNVVKKYADLTNDEFVLDLYCGTGTIGIYLSDKAKKVVGIEINGEAVKDANENRVLNNINNIEFICRDANKVINDYKDIDLVVVDPPRSGLMGKSINNIINISPKKIVYVSCDPATLARDINLLKDVYEVKEITLVDMFPNTYHVESVVLLESTGITK